MLSDTFNTSKDQGHAGQQQIIALAFDKVGDQGILILQDCTWAAQCDIWLLVKLTLKGGGFSFLLQDCDLAIERDPKEFAAQCDNWLLIRLTPEGGVFSFMFFCRIAIWPLSAIPRSLQLGVMIGFLLD